MTGALLAIVFALATGLPAARALDRSARGTELFARAVLLGLAVDSVVLFIMSAVGVHWTGLTFGAILTVLSVAMFLSVRSRGPAEESAAGETDSRLSIALLLCAVVLLVGYGLFATVGPLPEFDFLSDWGLKGRVFFDARGIDWSFLETAKYRATHADYPILLPLTFDTVAVLSGDWNDRWFGLLYVAWAAATLLLLRSLLRRELASSRYATIAMLALLPLATSPWIGLGEGPLIAYATSGLMLLRHGIRTEDLPLQRTGSLLLGIAALVKNEGVALVAAAVIAALVSSPQSRRALRQMIPAVLIAATWQVIRWMHRLPTDLATGSVASRVLQHLREPQPFIEAITKYNVGKPLMWVGIFLGLLIIARKLIHEERFIVVTIALQCANYLLAYASTPHDMEWHVRWSWERIVSHVALPVAFIVISQLRELLDQQIPIRSNESVA